MNYEPILLNILPCLKWDSAFGTCTNTLSCKTHKLRLTTGLIWLLLAGLEVQRALSCNPFFLSNQWLILNGFITSFWMGLVRFFKQHNGFNEGCVFILTMFSTLASFNPFGGQCGCRGCATDNHYLSLWRTWLSIMLYFILSLS